MDFKACFPPCVLGKSLKNFNFIAFCLRANKFYFGCVPDMCGVFFVPLLLERIMYWREIRTFKSADDTVLHRCLYLLCVEIHPGGKMPNNEMFLRL